MSHIRSKDTKAELDFRRYIWGKGIRGYRTYADVTGKPDIYFPRKKIAVFIDGCFWHKCPKCFIEPKSKNGYWSSKIRNNTLRDKEVNAILKNKGILVMRFWEHTIKSDKNKCYREIKRKYEKR